MLQGIYIFQNNSKFFLWSDIVAAAHT